MPIVHTCKKINSASWTGIEHLAESILVAWMLKKNTTASSVPLVPQACTMCIYTKQTGNKKCASRCEQTLNGHNNHICACEIREVLSECLQWWDKQKERLVHLSVCVCVCESALPSRTTQAWRRPGAQFSSITILPAFFSIVILILLFLWSSHFTAYKYKLRAVVR